MIDEDKIDRRAHWIQAILVAIVAATVWCVKLEMNSSSQADDLKQYKKDMKATFKEMDNSVDDLTHRIIVLETESKCKGGSE